MKNNWMNIVLGIVLVCTSGCAYFDRQAVQYRKLRGDWIFGDKELNGPMVLRFKKNRTYEVDFDNDGKKDIWGKVEFFNDMIKFTGEEASIITNCRNPGFYEQNIKNGHLELPAFADECRPRTVSLAAVREKKKK